MSGKISKQELSPALKQELDKSGNLDSLTTENKSSLVGAVNEVDGDVMSHKAENATLTEKAHVEQGIVSTTILSTGWTGSEAPYTQVVTATGVKAGDVSTVDIDLSNATDYAEEQVIADEWAKIYRIVATDDDEITVYATEETTEDIEVTIKVVR